MNPWTEVHIRRDSCQNLLAFGSKTLQNWLSAGEREVLERLRDPIRRRAWICGRLLLKQVVLEEVFGSKRHDGFVEPQDIEIYSLDALGRPTRPRSTVRGRLQPWNLSIAHTEQTALVALSLTSELSIGVDVTTLGQTDDGFRGLWLTGEERRWSRRETDPFLVPTLWAIKEAMYKAANRGESFAPARIEVSPNLQGGYTCLWKGREPKKTPAVRVQAGDGEITALVALCAAKSEEVR
jgi:4'-phosphopantetheinyl transferase EntD